MRKLLVLLSIVGMTMAWSHMATAFEEAGNRPSRHAQVEVWLNKHNGAVYEPGQHVRVYFQASEDCYVAVYNVDTEGFVHALYPKYNDQTWVEGGRIYEIPDPYDEYDLIVDGPTGIEYVVTIASHFPLNLRALFDIEDGLDSDIYWPMGRVTGDPHLAIHEINQQLAWGNDEYEPEGYSSDVSWFYVRRWVPYPRYIVYHWYPDRFYDPWWDPYIHVGIWMDFYWDHHWCRPWWWYHGYQPIYVYWYIDRDTGRRCTWKGYYHQDRRKPDWYRDKPVRWGGGGERPSRFETGKDDVSREDRRRPSWNDPGVEAKELKDRAKRGETDNLNRRLSREEQDGNRNLSDSERRSRRPSYRIDRGAKSKSQSRTEIRSGVESQRSRKREVNRERSPARSETKKVKKSSGRSSSLGKIIGSVAKVFIGDSKKEKSSSQKKSGDTGSKKERSSSSRSKQNSKGSTSTEERSRRNK